MDCGLEWGIVTAQGINDEHGEKFIIVNLSHFCDAIVKKPKLFVGGTAGSKTVAMFGSFGLIAMQCLTAWKLCLVLVG